MNRYKSNQSTVVQLDGAVVFMGSLLVLCVAQFTHCNQFIQACD